MSVIITIVIVIIILVGIITDTRVGIVVSWLCVCWNLRTCRRRRRIVVVFIVVEVIIIMDTGRQAGRQVRRGEAGEVCWWP